VWERPQNQHEEPERRWKSVEERLEQRNRVEHPEFKKVRRLRKKGLTPEHPGDIPLIGEEERSPSGYRNPWLIGGEERGSKEWNDIRERICQDEALLLLGIKRRSTGGGERTWVRIEQGRERRCKEYEVPYIRIPWPGKEFEVGYVLEEAPGNAEAIQEIIKLNLVLHRAPYAEKLEKWLHPELKEERRRKEMEESERRAAEALVLRQTMYEGIIQGTPDQHEPRIQMAKPTLEQWLVQIEDDERQRMETSTQRRTRERRQEIREHRHFLKQDVRFRGIVRTIRRVQDGPERREAIRRFWEDTYAEVYADPLVQAAQGNPSIIIIMIIIKIPIIMIVVIIIPIIIITFTWSGPRGWLATPRPTLARGMYASCPSRILNSLQCDTLTHCLISNHVKGTR
jgi:hypothetical protein